MLLATLESTAPPDTLLTQAAYGVFWRTPALETPGDWRGNLKTGDLEKKFRRPGNLDDISSRWVIWKRHFAVCVSVVLCVLGDLSARQKNAHTG